MAGYRTGWGFGFLRVPLSTPSGLVWRITSHAAQECVSQPFFFVINKLLTFVQVVCCCSVCASLVSPTKHVCLTVIAALFLGVKKETKLIVESRDVIMESRGESSSHKDLQCRRIALCGASMRRLGRPTVVWAGLSPRFVLSCQKTQIHQTQLIPNLTHTQW